MDQRQRRWEILGTWLTLNLEHSDDEDDQGVMQGHLVKWIAAAGPPGHSAASHRTGRWGETQSRRAGGGGSGRMETSDR